MTDGTTYERLKKIIVEQLGVDEEEVQPQASFVEDLNADSLDLVELIMSLEEEFGMEISDEDAEPIQKGQDAGAVQKVSYPGQASRASRFSGAQSPAATKRSSNASQAGSRRGSRG